MPNIMLELLCFTINSSTSGVPRNFLISLDSSKSKILHQFFYTMGNFMKWVVYLLTLNQNLTWIFSIIVLFFIVIFPSAPNSFSAEDIGDCDAPPSPKVNWSQCDLSNSDFRNVDLSKANLKWSNLSNSDLSGAILKQTDLTTVNLTDANLTNADFTGAVLYNSNLSGAIVDGIKLQNTDIRFLGV